jgi:hypothetical protein
LESWLAKLSWACRARQRFATISQELQGSVAFELFSKRALALRSFPTSPLRTMSGHRFDKDDGAKIAIDLRQHGLQFAKLF